MRFLARIVANSLGILLASLVFPRFVFSGDFKILLGAGLALSLANLVIRPIIKLFSLPLIILTLGLFLIVVNMIVLKIVDYLVDSLAIGGIGTLLWGTLVVSAVNGITLAFIAKKKAT
ncbi:MAG: phage holin family protein [bacterium]|nr:phage holin family protein [bacterium]